jgi:chemotaxis signal transduction protein
VVGLLVDEVRHVVRLSSAEIELSASVLGADLSDHVLGVGRPEGDFVVLLDLASMVET